VVDLDTILNRPLQGLYLVLSNKVTEVTVSFLYLFYPYYCYGVLKRDSHWHCLIWCGLLHLPAFVNCFNLISIVHQYVVYKSLECSVISEVICTVTYGKVQYIKIAEDLLLSLTNALDISLPRANPDVCAGASVGAGRCSAGSYEDKILIMGSKLCLLV